MNYTEALLGGRLTTSRGDIVQPKFIGSLRKRVDELLDCDPGLKDDLYNYLNYGRWPTGGSQGEKGSLLLSWYLQWFGVPAPFVMKAAVEKIKPKPKLMSSSLIPFLRLLFPSTHINAIGEMDKFLTSWHTVAWVLHHVSLKTGRWFMTLFPCLATSSCVVSWGFTEETGRSVREWYQQTVSTENTKFSLLPWATSYLLDLPHHIYGVQARQRNQMI